jgi:hypothetical protein
MATVRFYARRLLLLSAIFSAYRRQRRAALRAELASTERADAAQLFEQGHFAAAVFAARVQLEWAIRERHNAVRGREKRRRLETMVAYLITQNVVDRSMLRRTEKCYRTASRVIHRGTCCERRAAQLVEESGKLVDELIASRVVELVR